jgi:hypothetical protein
VVTPLTQIIVPAVAAELSPEAQDPWSLFGGFAQTNGHAQWYSISECPFFESVGSQMAYYIPWDPCPVGQDCIASFSSIFSVYEYSDGWTAVARPTLVTGVNNQAGEVGRSFEELGNYFVSATLWDASMTNPSNTLSSEFHIRELKPECPNARCDGFETFSSCPEDCPASCGDGVCGAGEDCTNCKADCNGGPGENLCTPSPSCGNGICECISSSTIPPPSGETSTNCPADCGTSQLDQSADPVSTLDRWETLLLCAALVGAIALRADRKFKLRSTSTT